MSMSGDITAKQLAVVTGASSGIGFELAKQFAQNDFDLLVSSEIGDARLEVAVKAFTALGAHVDAVEVDLATYDGVETLYEAIVLTGRPVDAIAINAGVGLGGDFRDTDLAAELRMIDLNVKSTVHLARRIVPIMSAQKRGRILFTSSIAALMPDPYEAVYGASKSFVFSFAEALRNELGGTGVTVTALQPGPTDTDFFHRAGMDDTKVGTDEKDDPALVAKQGFEALMAGKDRVIAGSLKTKAQAAVIGALPDTVKADVHRSLAEPGSGS
jgi:short-subunit dehydrogenase